MAKFLRVVRKRRWYRPSNLAWLRPGEIQGDALIDLKTSDNCLSVYRVENEDDVSQVTTALAANRENLCHLDYVIFNDDGLRSTGIRIAQSNGTTPNPEVNHLHYHLCELTIRRIFNLAYTVSNGVLDRIPEGTVKARLRRGIQDQILDEDKMCSSLVAKVIR